MKFEVIRELRKVERGLDKHIDRASTALGPAGAPERFARALRGGRGIVKHPMWQTFLHFARPVLEAQQHVAAEREYHEREIDHAITEAVKSVRRQK